MSGNVEEYNLPLRHWLIMQVNSGRYYGLEWNAGKYIKIPWIQQHHPGWEESYKLFVAWAKHKGKYSDPPNYTQLKGNFRGAMQKSNDFLEISSESNLQNGNYRLYKLLNSKEAKEQKRLRKDRAKRKRSRKSVEEAEKNTTGCEKYTYTPWDPSNAPPPLTPPISAMTPITIIPPDTGVSGNYGTRFPDEVMMSNYDARFPDEVMVSSNSSTTSDGNYETEATTDSLTKFKSEFFEAVDRYEKKRKSETTCTAHSEISDEIGVNFNEYMVDTCHEGGTSGSMLPSPPMTNEPSTSSGSYIAHNAAPFDYVQLSNQNQKSKFTISKVLQAYNVSCATLPRFNMRLYYEDKVVMERNLDLTARPNFTGYRLFFGNGEEQEKLFKMSAKGQEMLYCEWISLPPCHPSRNKTIIKLLDAFQQGITVEYDANAAVLLCTRYSRSGVFFCGTDSAIKLVRRERTAIFDYHSNLSKFLHLNKTAHMQSELVIGTQPHRNKLIKLKFRPILAMKLDPLNFNGSIASDFLSCCLDEPDSLDRQLERMKI